MINKSDTNVILKIDDLVERIDKTCSSSTMTFYKIASAQYMKFLFAAIIYNSNKSFTENELLDEAIKNCNINYQSPVISTPLSMHIDKYYRYFMQMGAGERELIKKATIYKINDYREVLR